MKFNDTQLEKSFTEIGYSISGLLIAQASK